MVRNSAVIFAAFALSVGSSLAAPISWQFNELGKRDSTSTKAPISATPETDSEKLALHVGAYRAVVLPEAPLASTTRLPTQAEINRNIEYSRTNPVYRAEYSRLLAARIAAYKQSRTGVPPRR